MAKRDRSGVTHGKNRKRKRGAHKGQRSPETRVWESDHLIPKCPPWLDRAVYVKLAALRESL